MSFELPDLDGRTYDQLVTEMVRLIPQFTTQWTDYNDSDPGIMLLQLLAWIDESVLYQLNQIPVETQQNFLRWVTGLAYSDNETEYSKYAKTINDFDFLDMQSYLNNLQSNHADARNKYALQKRVLDYVDSPYLALTEDDIRSIALSTNQVIDAINEQRQEHDSAGSTNWTIANAYIKNVQQVLVVYLLSNQHNTYHYPQYPNTLEYANNTDITRKTLVLSAEADVSAQQQATTTLLDLTQQHVQPRLSLGSKLNVRMAQLTDIDLIINLTLNSNSQASITLNALFVTLFNYFLPLKNNTGAPWVYDDAPKREDLLRLIEEVPGVKTVDDVQLSFYPTTVLNAMAQLGCNTLLADLPAGESALVYAGLPRLRFLDVVAAQHSKHGTRAAS